MKLSRRNFIKTAVLSGMGMDSVLKNSIFANNLTPNASAFASATNKLVITNPSEFKILQLTDIHFFAKTTSIDWQTMADLPGLVEYTKPDIILVTGDFWHNNPDGRGEEFMHTAISIIDNLNIPWAFTWGNHDQLNNYENGHAAFTNAPHSLYCGGASNGNYVIEIRNQDDDLLWDLICMNSSIGGGSPGLAFTAQSWMSELLRFRADGNKYAPHAFAFFHIPVPQYLTVWNAGSLPGVKFEDVYSGSQDDSNAFNLFKNLQTMRACFCGHDHVNDYGGVLDGIELVYGRATGYGGYGGDYVDKGGKLITVNCETSDYSYQSVPFKQAAGIDDAQQAVADVFQLEQNYPNPFNPSTNIRYRLSQHARVRLSVFDITGKHVKTLVDGRQSAGMYTLNWNGDNYHGNKVAAGTYYYQLLADNFCQTKSMILLK